MQHRESSSIDRSRKQHWCSDRERDGAQGQFVQNTSFRDPEGACVGAKMKIFTALCLFWTAVAVNSERHTLTYMYTALSRPTTFPGIHEFTAMGILDDKMIDYFDSDNQTKVPKTDWMQDRLPADYWTKGTQSRKSKQQWFKVNIDILMKRMMQNDTDLHVLQWLHGCEADFRPDGSLAFVSGRDMYSYDGNNFLSFDDAHQVWVAPSKAAEQTKRKWDNVQVLKEYTKGYLEKECVDWLSKFWNYGNGELQQSIKKKPPKVHVFAKNTRVREHVELTCFATGYYPKNIILLIRMNNRVLTKADGLKTTGSLPNGDGTYQRRDSIEILRDQLETYTCEVSHSGLNEPITKIWDNILPPDESDGLVPIIAGVVIGIVVVLGVVLGILYKKGVFGCRNKPREFVSVIVPPPGPTTAFVPLNGASASSSETSSNKSEESSTLLTEPKNGSTDSGVACDRNSNNSNNANGSNDSIPEAEGLMGNEEV